MVHTRALLPCLCLAGAVSAAAQEAPLTLPAAWHTSAPLISPEKREADPSHAQKDPTVVFYGGRWHLFMTIKCPGASRTEYCSFARWEDADRAPRTVLRLTDSKYYCAPQVFYFRPHRKWYLVYQMGVPGRKKMWVAYSTTTDIADPHSWTRARPMLDGGEKDPRVGRSERRRPACILWTQVLPTPRRRQAGRLRSDHLAPSEFTCLLTIVHVRQH